MKKLLVASGIVNFISIAGLILFFAIYIPTFGMWFYRWQYDANDTYAVVNMEPEELHRVTRHMLDYMRGRAPDLQIEALVGGELRPFFSPIEIRHMVDVYDLFSIGFFLRNLFIILAVVSILPFILLRKKVRRPRRILYKCWRVGALAVAALLALLVIVVAINWHHAFVVFHEIFFDNDYWILDGGVDLLINIVPYPFFITISIFIGAAFALGLALMTAITFVKLKWLLWLILGVVGFGITLALSPIILLVLFSRFKYSGRCKKDGLKAPWEYDARFSWLFVKGGIARGQELEVRVFGKILGDDKSQGEKRIVKDDGKKEEEKGEKEEKKQEKPSRFGALKGLNFEYIKTVAGYLFEFLGRVLRVARPRVFWVKGRVGLEEPHNTGLLLAAVGALAMRYGLDVDINGDFHEKALHLDAYAKGRIRPVSLLAPAISLIRKPEIKRLIFNRSKDKKPQGKDENNGNRTDQ